jgi:hypothetical protein
MKNKKASENVKFGRFEKRQSTRDHCKTFLPEPSEQVIEIIQVMVAVA